MVSCDSVISSDDHVRTDKEVQTSEFDLDEFAKHYKVQNVPPRNLELLRDSPSYASDGFQEKRNNYFAILSMSKCEAELIAVSTRG